MANKVNNNICAQCGRKISRKHLNQIYCTKCNYLIREKNIHIPRSAKEWQIDKVIRLAGVKEINEIAKEIGMSRSSVKRIGNYFGISFFIQKYSDDLIEEVLKFYWSNGKKKTAERFPDVKVRTIIDHKGKGYRKRQKRWTDEQIIQLIRMAGIIPIEKQYKIFNRPLAHKGSIKSAWTKKFGVAQKRINGLYTNKALYIAKDKCPYIETQFYDKSKLYLWIDLEKNLKTGINNDIKLAVKTLANFQRWIWGGGYIKMKILKMIKKYEV